LDAFKNRLYKFFTRYIVLKSYYLYLTHLITQKYDFIGS